MFCKYSGIPGKYIGIFVYTVNSMQKEWYCVIWGQIQRYLGANTVVFGANTLVFWAETVGFVAESVVFG